jgi:hypothetical protein
MWARVVEIMLGAWLVISPLVFRDTPDLERYIVNDMVSGSLVIAFALLCFWRRATRAHLATLVLGAWLAGFGYFSAPRPGPPAAQNEIVLGLLLMVFAVVPTEAARPPEQWRARQEAGDRRQKAG